MSLKNKIQEEAKNALKSGERVRRLVLNMLLTSVKNKEIEKRTKLSKDNITDDLDKKSELTDDEIISVISSEVKKRKEAIEAYQKGGREELAVKELDELEVLKTYLPEQMGEQEVREIVKRVILETGAKDIKEMGKVIGSVMVKVKGKADGSMVSMLVKEELS